jgi:hypothetical protein
MFGGPVATNLLILLAWDLPSGKVCQLMLFPGFEPVEQFKIRRRIRKLKKTRPKPAKRGICWA